MKEIKEVLMRKLLYILVILAAGLCYYMTRPETIHEKAGTEAPGSLSAAVSNTLSGSDGSALTALAGAWNIKYTAHARIPKEDWVSLNEMSPYLPQAQVAIEDKRFYSHHGIDPDGILRAALVNLQADDVVQGGSTLTQQLAKNLLLSREQTMERKALEAVLALTIEARCTKDEILEMYLNTTFLGAGATGVKQASLIYFHRDPKELSLAQAATLAGLPYAPTALNPLEHSKECKERRNLVLRTMNQQGLITQHMLETAQEEPLLP